MTGPARRRGRGPSPRAAYTLIEILVACALSLMILGAVMAMFGQLGNSITDSRAMLEISDRLRAAQAMLQSDLAGVTVSPVPPLRADAAPGYLEVIEGPVGAVAGAIPAAVNNDAGAGGTADTTVSDFDDILMFTTRSASRPFVGRLGTGTFESDVAEVAWFLRGRTLYRRVLLVSPGIGTQPYVANFFASNDISVRLQNGSIVPNSLADLTRPENRYAHIGIGSNDGYPFTARVWGQYGLPTLRESALSWPITPSNTSPLTKVDLWAPQPGSGASMSWLPDPALSAGAPSRTAEDVVLTNVIGFDVRVWDPTAVGGIGDFVNLGYGNVAYAPANMRSLGHLGTLLSGLSVQEGDKITPRVYDTWSFHYENDGLDQDYRGGNGFVDEGTNGFDDNIPQSSPANGLVDDVGLGFDLTKDGIVDPEYRGEQETMPPYPVPLRAIQVKIRVFEPDSRQIREVTVVQDFLPK